MNPNNYFLQTWIIIFTLFCSTVCYAHGGLSQEMDTCKITLDPYIMHFSGYQITTSGNEEFCEDIPDVGHTFIVLDAIDRSLRFMEISVKIVRNVDLLGVPDKDGEIIYHTPYNNFPTGSIRVEQTFTEPGYFVGIVSIKTPSGQEIISRFPFSVGMTNLWPVILKWCLIFLLMLSSAFVLWRWVEHKRTFSAG